MAMARALYDAGFRQVHCTPHLMKGGYDAGNDDVRRILGEVQARLDAEGVTIRLHPGREYYLDEYLLEALADPLPLGTSRHVLIELPHRVIHEEMVKQTLFQVVSSGLTPVIAHPERNAALVVSRRGGRSRKSFWSRLFSSASPDTVPEFVPSRLLAYLMEIGCCFQGNWGSLAGVYGDQVRQQAESMKFMGLYDRMGSDLHSLSQAKAVLAVCVHPAD